MDTEFDLLYTPNETDDEIADDPEDDLASVVSSDIVIISDNPGDLLAAEPKKKVSDRPPLPDGWTQQRDENNRLYTFNELGQPRCGAWNSKRHKYCNASPMTGKNRCGKHGGKSLSGIDSPRYKTGDHSIYHDDLPPRLRNRLTQAMNNPSLTSMRNEIAVLETRLSDVLSRSDLGESGELWVKLKKVWGKLMLALKVGDEIESTELMAEVGSFITRGHADYVVWNEAERTIERMRKAKESERRLLMDMNQVVYAEQLMGVIAILTDSIQRNVPDRNARAAITKDIRDILTQQQQTTTGKGKGK